MPKPRRASEKPILIGTEVYIPAEKVETAFEGTLDASGRFSRLGEHAGKTCLVFILKPNKT